MIALLAIYVAVGMSVAARKGFSFDEGEQLAIGYDQYLRKDFRMEGANGDLIKRWAVLPFLVNRPYFLPTNDPVWLAGEPYRISYEFLFRRGNQADALRIEARAMALILGVATGLLVYFISRSLFGEWGGLVSLALFVLSPHMLAFGALVSTEMPLCLTLFASTWCIWRLLHRVSWARLAASLACLGFLILAKPTAFIIVPITAVLVGFLFFTRQPLDWRLGARRIVRSRGVLAGIVLGLFVLHAVAGWAFVWADYDFRFAASPNPADHRIVVNRISHPDPIEPAIVKLMAWSRGTHFLPEGYLNGIEWLVGQNDVRESFIDGHWRFGGTWDFFPKVVWLKGTPAVLLLVVAGALAWLSSRGAAGLPSAPIREAVPWVALIAVYFGATIMQNLNIGHRHILPIYPPLFVIAGGVAVLPSRTRKWAGVLVAATLLWLAGDTIAVFPDYLAYFNPLAGGRAHGYQRLVDSSLDWGMDLPTLRIWLDEHNPGEREPVFLSYFGTDSPGYEGLKCKLLPSYYTWARGRSPYALEPGLYAISATMLQCVYLNPFGPWNSASERAYGKSLENLRIFNATSSSPERRRELLSRYSAAFWLHEYDVYDRLRFARLCAWLRHHGAPIGTAGNSILIYKLDAGAIRSAIEGPPPELDDTLLHEVPPAPS